MVFDNCQIDVFFHMRSHYSRLKNVQSVVDCSPPKALKRTSHSESSFQHVEMANHPKQSYGTKKHNCGYGQLTDLVTPDNRHPPSKNKGLPSRPKTRRHPEDLPQCTPEKHSRSTGNKSSRTCYKYPLACIGYLHKTPKSKNKDVYWKNINLTARTLDDVSCPSARSSHPNTGRNVGMDKTPTPSKSQQTCPFVHKEGEKVVATCTTPENNLLRNGGNLGLDDHEYLQFLLRITEDIIKNDLYSNKEMKKVFTNHVKANKDRLELDRMLLRIHELMKELNIPLGIEAEENSSASWTDIETAMKGLLCMEKMKPLEDSSKQDGESGTKHSTKEKCICFDLRSAYLKNNPNDSENINNTPTNAFRTSLDRLTEHTEPPSSRATCKISTSVSNFGDIDVLPGFECLETPKVSTGVLCELYTKRRSANSIKKTVCHCHLFEKKPKKRKRKVKKRKKVKRTKKIDKGKEDKTVTKRQNNDTQYETKNVQDKSSSPKSNEKPIIITLQEPNTQASGSDSSVKNSQNDYVFIKGPIYLLKEFLEGNRQMIIGNELPRNDFVSSKISPRANDTDLIDETSNNSETTGNNDKIIMYSNQGTEKNKEYEINEKDVTCNDENNSNSKFENNKEHVLKENENNLKSMEAKNNKKDDISEDERNNNEKLDEIRNILMEMTNFPISSLTSLEDEREETYHYFSTNDGCGRSDISVATENNYLCKITCPNKYICEKLRLVPTELNRSPEIKMESSSDELDLTPQKDSPEEVNSKNGYSITSNLMQDFLTTREIQTEDVPHESTVVGAALLSQDKANDTEPSDNSEVELNQSGSNENTKHEDPEIQPMDDYFAFEKEINEPKRYNLLMTAKRSDLTEDHHLTPSYPEMEMYGSDPRMPIVDSVQTNDTFATLASTATVERAKQFPEMEEQMVRKKISPLFQPFDMFKVDSGEQMHQRKVSILKNPMVQVPVDKVFNENDESKKKGESIIRAVESLKERQTTRDPFLDKVLQDIGSSRETRVPEKMASSEVSERSEHLALPGPSALKNTGKSSYFPSSDLDHDSRDTSYEEIPFNIRAMGQQDEDIKTLEQSENTEVSSEAASDHNYFPHADDQIELRGTASQITQINRVNAKLDQLRHVQEKEETEISKTLDKLVETLKEQQEKDEEVLEKTDEPENKQGYWSNRKHSFKCCGFCKKKKTSIVIPFDEPPQSAFSEEDYKAKSEAFELALAGLGQRQKTPENDDQKRKYSKTPLEDSETKLDDDPGPSPIVHSGNRLSLVRIADEKENDLKNLNANFENISTKISTDRIK